MRAAIYGLSGLEITPEERAFFRDADAAGYILFWSPMQVVTGTVSPSALSGP